MYTWWYIIHNILYITLPSKWLLKGIYRDQRQCDCTNSPCTVQKTDLLFLIGMPLCWRSYSLSFSLWVSSTISVNKRALTCSKPINLIRGQVCQLAMSRENQSLSASSWCSKHIHPSNSIVACELLPGGYCNMVSINTLKCPSTRNWTLTAQSVLCWWSWPLKWYDRMSDYFLYFYHKGIKILKSLQLWFTDFAILMYSLQVIIDSLHTSHHTELDVSFICNRGCANTFEHWIM